MRFKSALLATASAGVLAASLTGSARAAVIDLTFEGIIPTYPGTSTFIENFYNGGTSSAGTSGTNYGVTFSANASALCLNTAGVSCSNTSRGGIGDPHSQLGALYIPFGTGSSGDIDVAAGFTTGFSFNYSAQNAAAAIDVYSGLDGTGTLLASVALPVTPSQSGTNPVCDGAAYCPFFPDGVAFAGTAELIQFVPGTGNDVVLDDVTFGSSIPGGGTTPLPATLPLFAGGAGLLGLLARRKKRNQFAAA